MNSRYTKIFTYVIFLLMAIIPITALAQGRVIIRPIINTSWRSDNNFYKTENNERKVYTYLIQPGIELGYDTGKTLIDLRYTLNDYNYDDQDDLRAGWVPADDEDYTGHTAGLNLKTRPNERLTMGFGSLYDRTRDAAAADPNGNSTERFKYDLTRFQPMLSYLFTPKFEGKVQYMWEDQDYSLSTKEDNSKDGPLFNLIYYLDRSTSFDLDYRRYDKDNKMATSDLTSDHVRLFLRKQFKRLSFEASGGYREIDFDDPAEQDMDKFTYGMGVRWQVQPSEPGAQPRTTFSLNTEQDLNDGKFTTRTYSAGFGHLITERIPFDLRGRLQQSDYDYRTTGLTPAGNTEIKDDDTYTAEASLGYIFNDWLRFRLAAGFEEKESNISDTDYDNNYIMAGINIRYNVGSR